MGTHNALRAQLLSGKTWGCKNLCQLGRSPSQGRNPWDRTAYWHVSSVFMHVSESTDGSVGIDTSEVSESTHVQHKNNIITKTSRAKVKKFKPPTLEEVEEYAKERGRLDLVKPFYDFFTAGDWIDSNGKAVRVWKQKFVSWERNPPNESKSSIGAFL